MRIARGLDYVPVRPLRGVGAAGSPLSFVDDAGNVYDLSYVSTSISRQRQLRHVQGAAEYRHGGYFASFDDAQAVFEAFHRGDVNILGVRGFGGSDPRIVFQYNGVTGYNVNMNIAGGAPQATNVFELKGSASPSIFPRGPYP